MIALAREARGYSQAELAVITGISRSNISKFEQESLQLSEGFIQAILTALKFPESLCYVPGDILPPAMYRSVDQIPMKLLNQIDARINIYYLGIARLLNSRQHPAPMVPSLPVSETGSALESAMRLRKAWKLKKGPLDNVTTLLESHGILTMPMDFGTERVDSRSVFIEDRYPIIFYNKALLGDRLRFTLAHELGHLIMHTRTRLTSFEGLAHEANLFAAEWLMPQADILKDLSEPVDLDLLAQLKGKWKVSMQALLYRAQDLDRITDNQKRYIINRFNLLKIRRREPKELDLEIERGHLLRDLITNYRVKQKMSVTKLAEFFYLNETDFLDTYN